MTTSALLAAFLLAPAAEGPHWHTDYAAARRLAREQDRPLFVVFRCEH